MLKSIKYILLALLVLVIPLLSFAEDVDSEFCNPGDYYWIIYDNVCPYCQNATKYIKQLDWEGKFKLFWSDFEITRNIYSILNLFYENLQLSLLR
jgi:hypothetical protein